MPFLPPTYEQCGTTRYIEKDCQMVNFTKVGGSTSTFLSEGNMKVKLGTSIDLLYPCDIRTRDKGKKKGGQVCKIQ
ncbi:hypothetical protein CR513_30600, partial [Mucuna pruriens]